MLRAGIHLANSLKGMLFLHAFCYFQVSTSAGRSETHYSQRMNGATMCPLVLIGRQIC